MALPGQTARRVARIGRRAGQVVAEGRSRVVLALRRPRASVRASRQKTLTDRVSRLSRQSPTPPPVTLVLAPRSGRPSDVPAGAHRATVVVDLAPDDPTPTVVDRAVRAASTPLVCVLRDGAEPLDDGWMDRLAEAIGEPVVAASPELIHPARPGWRATSRDLLVRESGAMLIDEGGTPAAVARGEGHTPATGGAPTPVDLASASCLMIDREAYLGAGGLPLIDDFEAAVAELCVRLRVGGGTIMAVPDVSVIDHRPIESAADLEAGRALNSRSMRTLVDRNGPRVRYDGREAASAELHLALTIAAPSRRAGAKWGDWYVAEGMAGALRRLGHRAVVQALDEVDEPRSRSCDVQIVLHGKANVRRTSGQSHVLWVISHPDTLDAGACDEADLVAVASRAHATRLARQTTTPVVELLQATDPARFGRRPADQRWQYPVAVVANARHVTRPIVSDALAAGLHPAVIGRGWGRGQGRELVVATHVRNDQLATVYSSIGVLLADHWPDMRRNQFVSNRLFDALACGTPIVCDANEGVTDLFGDIVATYAQPEELGELVAASLRDPVAARARAEEGKSVVLAHHTFDDRAAQLLAHLHDLGLV